MKEEKNAKKEQKAKTEKVSKKVKKVQAWVQKIFQKNINPNALSKIQETQKTQEALKKQENNTSCKEKGVVVS